MPEKKATSQNFKYTYGSDNFELIRAEVISINYKDQDEQGRVNANNYSLYVRPLTIGQGGAAEDQIRARPLDTNIKRIPLIHEVVLILKGPTSFHSSMGTENTNYYLNTFALQNTVHINGLPGLQEITVSSSKTDTSEQQAGLIEDTSKKSEPIFSNSIPSDLPVNALQPYAGDVLMEGRFGSSIRLGSTIKFDEDLYNLEPYFSKGKGQENDPLLIIANGRKKNGTYGKFIVENNTNDLVSLAMTSTQKYNFKIDNKYIGAAKRLKIDYFDSDKLTGAQAVLHSQGRIMLSTLGKEISLMANDGVVLSSNSSISLDAGQDVEIGNAKRINLGLDAKHPVPLGDDLVDLLKELTQELSNLCSQLSIETHISPTGPTTPPANASEYIRIGGKIQSIGQKLPTVLSELVFLNKKENMGTASILTYEELERSEYSGNGASRGEGGSSGGSGGGSTSSGKPINRPPTDCTGKPPEPPQDVVEAMRTFGITTPLQRAHFLAQVAHESGNFRYKKENLNYSAEGLNNVFPKYFMNATPPRDATKYHRKPEKIASVVYANRMGNGSIASGEGWKYRGRGYMQLTGKNNYTQFNKSVPDDVVRNPDLVETKYAGATAGWFWQSRNLNSLAVDDTNNTVARITKKVNGGLNGIDHRELLFCQYWRVLKEDPTKWS